jgi:hypothetical protein
MSEHAESTRPASPQDALTTKDICSDTAGDRTTRVYISNHTNWTIKIGFVQLLDESGNVPPGYISNTGVMVLGVNTAPGGTAQLDPCYAGGDKRPIQATRAKGSLKLTDGSHEIDHNLHDIQDGDVTTYYPTVGWNLTREALGESSKVKK